MGVSNTDGCKFFPCRSLEGKVSRSDGRGVSSVASTFILCPPEAVDSFL